jgi:outer membrane protein TolC
VRTKAVYRERLATFSQDFLQAAWEVEALAHNESRQRELLEALTRRRTILESVIKQARSRYDAGLTDYLPVLSTTQQLYAVEQRSIRENRRLATIRVALHRAMGGPVTRDPAQPAFSALSPKPQKQP